MANLSREMEDRVKMAEKIYPKLKDLQCFFIALDFSFPQPAWD